jgi:hypothetical protein
MVHLVDQPVAEPARARVDMDRVDGQIVPAGDLDRLGQSVWVDPELGRPVAVFSPAIARPGRVD